MQQLITRGGGHAFTKNSGATIAGGPQPETLEAVAGRKVNGSSSRNSSESGDLPELN
jgi:hypothetical protein